MVLGLDPWMKDQDQEKINNNIKKRLPESVAKAFSQSLVSSFKQSTRIAQDAAAS